MLLPGTILLNRYVVRRSLGGGGMGTVYQADDGRLGGKAVALKQLTHDPAATPAERAEAERLFRDEALLLARLSHPNLPRVSDFFTEGGESYLVMDFIEGRTLQEIMDAAGGPLPEAQVLPWAGQLCDVLGYLHGQRPPVVFRDLKPANIMIDRSAEVKLIDFGIARLFTPGKRTDTLRMGTVGYAPPEQFAGQGQTDARSDIYSLGVTLHYLLTGRDPAQYPPFSAGNTPIRSLSPWVSWQTEAAVARSLAYDPAGRYQNAAEFRAAFPASAGAGLSATVAAGSRSSAATARAAAGSPPRHGAGRGRRGPAFIMAGVAIVLLLAGALWALSRPPGPGAGSPLPNPGPGATGIAPAGGPGTGLPVSASATAGKPTVRVPVVVSPSVSLPETPVPPTDPPATEPPPPPRGQ